MKRSRSRIDYSAVTMLIVWMLVAAGGIVWLAAKISDEESEARRRGS